MDALLEQSGVDCSALDDNVEWSQMDSMSIGLTTPGAITDEAAVYESCCNAVGSGTDTGGNACDELPDTFGDSAVAAVTAEI